jgi:hypothetical protein
VTQKEYPAILQVMQEKKIFSLVTGLRGKILKTLAELNTGDGGGKKSGKVRSKKSNAKVDLTAMVDWPHCFMLTTTLSKPQSMSLGLPDKSG